jgi:dTMP kinase
MRAKTRENFVVFEGLDGAGTSTQIALVDQALGGIAHWVTSEPSRSPAGRLLRDVLKGREEMSPQGLAYLFACDRNEHLYGPDGIVEHLERGEIVVCDRYLFSSIAYQGVDAGFELVSALNEPFPLPESLVWFDIDPRLSMARIEGRSELEIFENIPFQVRVRHSYLEAIDSFRGSDMELISVRAELAKEEVLASILSGVRAFREALGLGV